MIDALNKIRTTTTSTTTTTDHPELDIDIGDSAEQALEATSVGVTNKLLGNLQLQALTESSSSGSITESVCTQYEPVGGDVMTVEEHKHVEVIEQEEVTVGFKKSNSTFLDGFLSASQMLKSLGSGTKLAATDGIRLAVKVEPFLFSTSNFSLADHRLQLYLHQNVFLASNEKFVGVLKGQLVRMAEGEQLVDVAIVVTSSKQLYLFVVVAEEADDPAQWLRLMKRVDLKEWVGLKILPFDVGVRFCFNKKSVEVVGGLEDWIVVLQDGQNTRNYVKVVTEEHQRRYEEDNSSDELKEALVMGKGEEEENLLMMTPVRSLTKIVNETAEGVEEGRSVALVVSNRQFMVLRESWMGLLVGDEISEKRNKDMILFSLAFTDMVECEVKSDTEFVLNFMDEHENQHELWCLEFETRYAAQAVLAAIEGPWEKAFGRALVQK